jgi:hypothetical protein
MQNKFSSVLAQIKDFRIPGIPKFSGQVHPSYNGFSIANLPASVCRWLSCPHPAGNPLDESILAHLDDDWQAVILLLVDGLSLRLFQRFTDEALVKGMHHDWQGILNDGLFLPLTSIAPSTTSAALTTLWTARLPAEHGIIGYELFLKEYGFIANMITHSVSAFIKEPVDIRKAGFNPTENLPVEPLGRFLTSQGVRALVYQHDSISSSGLSQMLLDGTERIAFDNLDDVWNGLCLELQENRRRKTYAYVYWSGLDTGSHHSGPDSELLYQEWLAFAAGLGRFIARLKTASLRRVLFLLTADHGQIATDIRGDFNLQNHTGLTRQLIMMPTGESRLPYLFIKPGQVSAVKDYLASHWDGQFTMMPSQRMLANGLLGQRPLHHTTLERVGDHIVFPKGNAYWWWVNKENHLLGRHGGLSADEMLVPFFALPI